MNISGISHPTKVGAHMLLGQNERISDNYQITPIFSGWASNGPGVVRLRLELWRHARNCQTIYQM